MKKLTLGIMLLLVFSLPVMAVGTLRLDAKRTYKDESTIELKGDLIDANSRYNLHFRNVDGRVSASGDLNVYGKGFRLGIKGIRAVSTSGVLAKTIMSITKWGKSSFSYEITEPEIEYENELTQDYADVHVLATLIQYPEKPRIEKKILRISYNKASDVLKVYEEETLLLKIS